MTAEELIANIAMMQLELSQEKAYFQRDMIVLACKNWIEKNKTVHVISEFKDNF